MDDKFKTYVSNMALAGFFTLMVILVEHFFSIADDGKPLSVMALIACGYITVTCTVYDWDIVKYKLVNSKLFSKLRTFKHKPFKSYRLKKNIKITSLDNIGKLHETIKELERLKETCECVKKYDGVKLQFFQCDERGCYTQMLYNEPQYVMNGDTKDAIADGLESYIEELEIALSKYVDM